jgi:hypothetical protein
MIKRGDVGNSPRISPGNPTIQPGRSPAVQPSPQSPARPHTRVPDTGLPDLKQRTAPTVRTGGAMPARRSNTLQRLKSHLQPSRSTGPADTTPLPSRNLAYMNLAAGVDDLKNLSIDDIPDMMARISVDQPGAVGAKPGSKEELVLQKMTLLAYTALNEAREETKALIEQQDRQMDRPLGKEERAQFQEKCVAILNGHQARIKQAVDKEWNTQQLRDSDRRDYNRNFAVDLAIKTTKLGVSVGTAATVVLSPAGIAAGALTALSMAKLIYKFSEDRDAALLEMNKGDAALQKKLQAGLLGDKAGDMAKQVTREMIVSLPISFADKIAGPTMKKQDDAILAFRAKSARLDKEVRKYYEKCISDLDKLQALDDARAIRAAEGGTPAAPKDQNVEKMRARIEQSLEKLTPLMKMIDADNEIHATYKERCDGYRANCLPPHMGEVSNAIQTAGRCSSAASALKKAVELTLTVAI